MDTINTQNIDTNSVDKKKNRFSKIIVALTMCFSIGGLGLGLALGKQYQKASAVSYDDEEYTITLNANELNNYTFNNLSNYMVNTLDDTFTIAINNFYYNDTNYDNDSLDAGLNYFRCNFNDDSITISYNYNNVDVEPMVDPDNKFQLYDLIESDISTFTYDLKLVCASSYYSGVKSAIELDIQANAPSSPNYLEFLQDFIELLVGGIGATATGIGTGLSSLVSALAIQNGAMSPFISIVLVFGGFSLAFALSRWVVNLLSSLGQRNR